MNFQDKVVETTADFRARAAALADTAVARARATLTAKRMSSLKTSLAALQVAGREFNKVARHHVSRFVQENAGLAREAGKDVSALARSTYSTLAKRGAAPARKTRKAPARKTARSRSAAKAA